MTHDDWIGLGTSVGVHLTLVLLFALLTAGRPTPPALGALQLEVGAFAKGRPVQQAEQPAADETPPSEAPPSEAPPPGAVQDASPPDAATASGKEAPAEAAPKASAPVTLPEQAETAGEDPPPEEPPSEPEQEAPPARASSKAAAPTASPSDASSTDQEKAAQEASSEPSSSARDEAAEADSSSTSTASLPEGGEAAGEATGAASGEEGTGDDEKKASPFDIEGLDRTRLYGAMPQYTENVEATIQVEITVSPDGRVIGQVPVLKANPSLEHSVMQALREWRFNRLPAGAPQKNQTGVVTFRFRLE